VTPAKSQSASDRRATAYLMLGVDPNAVLLAPRISHLIARIKGGKLSALEALRASDLPEARLFASKYDNPLLPSFVRRDLPLEAFSIAAGISPTRLWGMIAELIRVQKAQLGAIKAAERHEEIVGVSSDMALNPLGVEDRMAHLKHMGFTPSPKGSQINILTNVSATANAAAKSLSAGAPPPEDTIRRIIESRQQRQQLQSAQQPALPESTTVESVPVMMPASGREPVTIDVEYDDAED